MRMIISGINGAMGKVLTDLSLLDQRIEIIGGIDKNPNKDPKVVVSPDLLQVKGDVIIDFSHPSLLAQLISYALRTKTPVVICTTGLDEDALKSLEAASLVIPVFHSGNMSFGINILEDILKTYSKLLSPTYDIEIIEKHHNRKVDAPSGTALMLADAISNHVDHPTTRQYGRNGIATKRQKHEIGIHAVRGGTIVGEHTVIFAGEDEIIELTHTALSRKLFASSALKAAEFITHMEPGLYQMSHVIQYYK